VVIEQRKKTVHDREDWYFYLTFLSLFQLDFVFFLFSLAGKVDKREDTTMRSTSRVRYTVAAIILCVASHETTGFHMPAFENRVSSSMPMGHTTRIYQSSITIEDSTIPGIDTESTSDGGVYDNILDNDSKLTASKNVVPQLGKIARMLPRECFQVDTKQSLFYFGVDMVAVTACLTFLHAVVTSDIYHGLVFWQQALMVAPLQVLSGFAMWCMWCIGHDAGHGTVSKRFPLVNRIVGEIAHSVVCLTPFVPWAKSHKKHHLNHNHLERDYSHQWFVREEKDALNPLFLMARKLGSVQIPFLYGVYLLLGIPDGGHVFFYGKMWQGESLKAKFDAAISVIVSIATAGTLWSSMGTADFAVVCMVPWLVTSFWLFMVTYLQHHSDDGMLYTDDTWEFTKGAFETVDRDYGKWVNRMSHHMMDGHVAHHLFFTKM
jgi:omega-3 fatty acid desaturase (delta-15 desaturase)